jgi:glycosyltransferase involved in cell wall biosynthesis
MKQRIAIVTTSYPTSLGDASGHFVRTEARALAADGHDVTVLCPGVASAHPADEFGDGILVWRCGAEGAFGWPGALAKLRHRPMRLLELPEFVMRSRSALLAGHFDRVIAHWLLGSGWPIALAGNAATEVVVHGSDARLLNRLGPLRPHILDSLRRRGCSLRLVAEHLRPLLRTPHNGAWVDAAVVRPLPLTLPDLPARVRLRHERGLGDATFLAVVVGRLVPSKRVDVALSRAPFPAGAHVVVIGSGPLQSRLADAFPDVHFTGQLDRTATLGWVKAADVVVSASLEEGAPTALREARLLNVPVWTAEYGSAAEWAARDPGVQVLATLNDGSAIAPKL